MLPSALSLYCSLLDFCNCLLTGLPASTLALLSVLHRTPSVFTTLLFGFLSSNVKAEVLLELKRQHSVIWPLFFFLWPHLMTLSTSLIPLWPSLYSCFSVIASTFLPQDPYMCGSVCLSPSGTCLIQNLMSFRCLAKCHIFKGNLQDMSL